MILLAFRNDERTASTGGVAFLADVSFVLDNDRLDTRTVAIFVVEPIVVILLHVVLWHTVSAFNLEDPGRFACFVFRPTTAIFPLHRGEPAENVFHFRFCNNQRRALIVTG
jgi:hypothetical protein